MAVRVRIHNSANGQAHRGNRRAFWLRVLQHALVAFATVFVVVALITAYYYHVYSQVVDERLEQPLFAQTAKIYAAAREVRVGQRYTPKQIASDLRQAGYSEASEAKPSPLGTFSLNGDSITVHPGAESFHAPDSATIRSQNGLVASIAGDNNQVLAAYDLEPALITGLSDDKNRTKRRLITYDELPRNLVAAVVGIEDRRFFEHGGVDYLRLAGALRDDLRVGSRREGGSTLTMQLARGFFLSPEKKVKRKLIEILITFQLEHRFTKKQIFELYANQINMGQQGSFAINGFGEAARVYFGKDIKQLDLAECAMLAGMIQHPSYLNPYRHPARVIERRNLVLDSMVGTGAITREESERAKAEPLHLSANSVDAGEAPYFVDLVHDQLTAKYGDRDINREGLRIYTSLDPDLQRLAAEAMDVAMKDVDELVRKRYAKLQKAGTAPESITYPQAALIALNPKTGQVLALVGGRNYGLSQLNHAVAKRPTGSIFKPFVYAAAFNTSLTGVQLPDTGAVFSPVTMLDDEQTTFTFGNNQEYTPRNFEGEYRGEVTARYALQYSLNNATISLAEKVGFNSVASLGRDAGIKSARGTPSVAIGAYDATPLDMAGAYTVFANNGVHITPWMLASVRKGDGDPIDDFTPDSKPVLDPRVAYLTTSLMQNVINAGTGYAVRRRGFEAPAAGKTGTSHDAWFAGFTSNLICIVWVGNDDYTDIKIQGADAAAPIWAEFMKHAVALPQYSDTRPFVPPAGVVNVTLDKTTNLLANSTCPQDYTVAFLDGTQPTESCDKANVDQRGLFQKLFGQGSDKPPVNTVDGTQVQVRESGQPDTQLDQDGQPVKKKGFFGRLFGGGDKPKQQPTPQSPPPVEPQQ